jgi:endonuclease/exonuclease/phosphatase family metal-dependent hydrolase
MLDEMSDFIDERTIILGDFNSSVYFDYKYRSHKDKNFSAWNQRMTQLGFVSSLHEKLGVRLDESTLNTYFHNNHQAYCIDYAYMHKSMLEEQGVKSVVTDERFRVASDHIPLIIDLK